jgi:hypothetical protein
MLQSFTVDNVFSNKRMTFSRNAHNFAFFGVEFDPPKLSPFLHVYRFSSEGHSRQPVIQQLRCICVVGKQGNVKAAEVIDSGRSFM